MDIYVTGSNSKLMSSEISTYLTGRYISIPVYMLSFREYLDFKAGSGLSRNELLEQYYLADVSLKYSLLGYDRKMLDSALENIVYLELLRRGYEVFIGKNETKEIDFVAMRQSERIYVQVCVRLPEDSDREVGNLMEIRDHYPKYVVTLDTLATGNENGIRIVHLADFLLDEKW